MKDERSVAVKLKYELHSYTSLMETIFADVLKEYLSISV